MALVGLTDIFRGFSRYSRNRDGRDYIMVIPAAQDAWLAITAGDDDSATTWFLTRFLGQRTGAHPASSAGQAFAGKRFNQ
jgi:hypothetical protein